MMTLTPHNTLGVSLYLAPSIGCLQQFVSRMLYPFIVEEQRIQGTHFGLIMLRYVTSLFYMYKDMFSLISLILGETYMHHIFDISSIYLHHIQKSTK